MKSSEDIIKVIRKAVEDVAGIVNLDDNASLVDKNLRIAPADFLYIFDILEKEVQVNVYDVLKDNTYHVMTVNGLATAISRLEA